VTIARLSDKGIRAFKVPERGQKTYWDEHLPNFGLRVSQGGTRSFVVMLGKERRLLTLGRYPTISLSNARKQAKALIAEEALGKFRPARTSFDEAKQEFLSESAEVNRPRTVKDYERLLTKHFQFGHTSSPAPTRARSECRRARDAKRDIPVPLSPCARRQPAVPRFAPLRATASAHSAFATALRRMA